VELNNDGEVGAKMKNEKKKKLRAGAQMEKKKKMKTKIVEEKTTGEQCQTSDVNTVQRSGDDNNNKQ